MQYVDSRRQVWSVAVNGYYFVWGEDFSVIHAASAVTSLEGEVVVKAMGFSPGIVMIALGSCLVAIDIWSFEEKWILPCKYEIESILCTEKHLWCGHRESFASVWNLETRKQEARLSKSAYFLKLVGNYVWSVQDEQNTLCLTVYNTWNFQQEHCVNMPNHFELRAIEIVTTEPEQDVVFTGCRSRAIHRWVAKKTRGTMVVQGESRKISLQAIHILDFLAWMELFQSQDIHFHRPNT